MFTGIVQSIAKVIFIHKKLNFRTHIIQLPDYMLKGLQTGDSVAHNGCCLTVKKIDGNNISFDLISETLQLTNLSELAVGDYINVERSIKLGDEIGGHLLSGHISTTAEISKKIISKNNQKIWFTIKNSAFMRYIFYKGFIGIDGVSLTVCKTIGNRFCVCLIPETLKRTILGKKKQGWKVNIEIDSQIQAIVDTVYRIWSREKDKKKYIERKQRRK